MSEYSGLIEPLIEFIQTNYPNRTTEYDKCRRDLDMIIQAMLDDVQESGQRHTKYIASKFWSRGESMLTSTDAELATYDELLELLKNPIYGGGDRFEELISLLKDWVSTGPKYPYYEWQGMLNNRIMTFNWQTEIPPEKHIKEIIHELHEYVPSKQRRVRYNIDIIPNYADDERKYMIYAGTKADPDKIDSRYNPQVLAPWLLVFSTRQEALDGVSQQFFEQEAWLEIGLASEFVNLAALNRGIDVGFCQCIRNRDEIEQELGMVPVLYLGLGYKDPSLTYYCPVYERDEVIPGRDHDTKPDTQTYVRWH